MIFTRFGPYHVARLEGAGCAAEQRGAEVIGIELAANDRTYAWLPTKGGTHFRRITLFPDSDYEEIGQRRIKQAVADALDRERPDAVALPGWAFPAAKAGLRWANDNGVGAVLMSESSRDDFKRRWWKELIKRRTVRRFQAALVGGSRHAAYACELGILPETVFQGYDAVDNAHFARGAEEARRDAESRRRQQGLPESFFMASARFVPKKNLATLLRAFAMYRAAADAAWDLVLCGDGPMRAELVDLAGELAVSDCVHLPGFVQYDSLPAYYGLAKAFVHASYREQWGLVVNEAMAAGLPVLVSDRCGCVPELVRPDINGFSFDPGDVGGLADLLRRVSGDEVDRESMRRESERIVAKWSPDIFGEHLWAAADMAVSREGARQR